MTQKKFNRFLFRVDGSTKIGSGHVMRCLTIAEALKSRNVESFFLSRKLMGNINDIITKKGFKLIELPEPSSKFLRRESEPYHSNWREVSWKQDAEETISFLKQYGFNHLVIDHYGIWEPWEKMVRKYIERITVVDDLADRKHICDFILDQNLNSKDQKYIDLVPNGCKLLMGSKYALVRQEFRDYRKASLSRRKKKKTNKIMISFGGGDPKNLVPKILKSFLKNNISNDLEIDIILGPMNQNRDECYNLSNKLSNKINFFDYVDNMAKVLVDVDLVIGAAGSSSWERCCLGVPSLIFSLANNQDEIAKNLDLLGASILLNSSDIENNKLSKMINAIIYSNELLEMSERSSQIVDGNGVSRVVKIIND